MGTFIVLAVIAAAAFLAARFLYRENKRGGGCSGNCSHCSGCGAGQRK